MPTNYARFLVGSHRTAASNRQLGWFLAFVAGAINAGGFLAVQQYTSHVTGMLSSLADNLALGHLALVVDAAVGVLSFLSTTTVFGTPIDITLSELALETFFPADEFTSKALRHLSDGLAAGQQA